jgi:hypothetical protein
MKIDKITPQIAALYLGQKCDSRYLISGISGSTRVETLDVSHILLLSELTAEIAPHLRRLESITEEEARELYMLATGMVWEKRSTGDCLFNWVFAQKKENIQSIYHCIGIPSAWLYLLSKGFDLFGLIDAGLAKEIHPEK